MRMGVVAHSGCWASGDRRAVIVTSYCTGAPNGKNVGVPGYSYDFVVQLFAPLIKSWGKLLVVSREELPQAVAQMRARGYTPVHLSFLPLQDVCFADDAPNIVVPAWEYPDVPNHVFDGNPQNNWVETARRCDALVVGGPFTADAFQRAGVRTPIQIVQVPTPDAYFQIPLWRSDVVTTINCCGLTFRTPTVWDGSEETASSSGGPRSSRFSLKSIRKALCAAYRRSLKRTPLHRFCLAAKGACDGGLTAWRAARTCSDATTATTGACSQAELSGVVYTSIFNPPDYRKNWGDLLTGFLWALRDCEDATLVLKVIDPNWVGRVYEGYRRSGIPHRCKVVVVGDFLTEEQLLELARATTYYVTTTRAEGNCLPLLNYLAAGRPGISPCHTAIGDYFDRDVGFVVDSHPEPTAFPHDSRFRKTTTWHRLVWTSLVEEIRRSYEMAKYDRAAYDRLARRAREKMRGWNSMESVGPRLWEALDSVVSTEDVGENAAIPQEDDCRRDLAAAA
ncbi:MAG: hypothetical protein LLF97_07320 [Planctomycetaceae bacterium]|nr:hypothetical protein [Planctomycetaceae bacterium]